MYWAIISVFYLKHHFEQSQRVFAGGMLTMTGDVLPCFDASTMVMPNDASCIVTVPITLDIASNHGVIVAAKSGISNDTYSINLVENLLQKPCLDELVRHQAILDDGRTLLDTGIIAVRGQAWLNLVKLACSSQSMISELLEKKKEASDHLLVALLNSFWYFHVPVSNTWKCVLFS